MATLPTIAFILIAASIFGVGVEANKPCPNYIIDANFANKTVDTFWIRKLVKSTLESKAFCKPTPLIKKLWNCILDMVDSKYDYLQNIAYIYTVRAALLLTTYNTDFSFCVTAEGLNATVNFANTEDVDEVAVSLKKFADSIKYNREIFTGAALSVANCKNVDPPKLTPPHCPDNGLVYYPIKKMWKLFGQLLPCCLKEVVFELYKSENEKEKAHALMVTATLTVSLDELFLNISQDSIYNSLYLLSIVKVQKCCCDERKDYLDQVTEERDTLIKKGVAELIEEKYSC